MRIIRTRQTAGMALLIVMIAVVSLSILAGIYAHSMKVEARLAMNSNEDTQLEWMGRSGVEAAKYVLGLQMGIGAEPYDALNQTWAGGPGTEAMSNSPLAGFSLKGMELGNGTVSVEKIVDLERKANINMASEEMLEQALVTMGVEPGDYPVIVNSILDWIDRDEAQRPQGAESDYYQAGDNPFDSKNGPIDDLGELLLVKGIYPEMYWGPNAAGYVPNRIQQTPRLGFNADMPAYQVGLVDLFTPVSSGRININTAPPSVLQLIPFVDQHVASQIVQLRAGPDGAEGTEDDIPFRNPGELVNANLNPQAVQQAMRFCDVRSRTFEVHVTAAVGNYSRKFIGIIVRNSPRDLQTISFHAVE